MTQAGQADTEIVPNEAEPKRGTKAWIEAQPVIEYDGAYIPDCHRLPPGATLLKTEDDGYCQVVMPERGRCRATRIRGMLLCSAHAGGGDPAAGVIAAREQRSKLKARRTLLGIGPNRVGNPRAHARLRALERADAIAEALIDAPLDDPNLGSVERQLAMVRGLDATFPLQQTTVEVELPASAEGVQTMGWEAMQALASRLLEPVPEVYQAIEAQ